MKTRGLKVNYLLVPLGVLCVSLIGGSFSGKGVSWYDAINLPPLAPHGSFIGVAWTIVFIFSALSILFFSNNEKTDRKSSFFKIVGLLFILNGLLNVLWSFLFFGLHLVFLSFVEMTFLNLINLILILMLWKEHRISAVLFIPYFLWVSFATYLTYSIYLLN